MREIASQFAGFHSLGRLDSEGRDTDTADFPIAIGSCSAFASCAAKGAAAALRFVRDPTWLCQRRSKTRPSSTVEPRALVKSCISETTSQNRVSNDQWLAALNFLVLSDSDRSPKICFTDQT
jgi:hypothetical protein